MSDGIEFRAARGTRPGREYFVGESDPTSFKTFQLPRQGSITPKTPDLIRADGFWPWMPKRVVAQHLRDLWSFVLEQVEVDSNTFIELREKIMANAEEYVARLDEATSEIAGDLQELKDAVAAAVADKDEAVKAAVEAELSKFDAPIAKLEALGKADDPQNPVPNPEPEPEAPVEEPGPVEPVEDGDDTPPAA